MKGQDKFVPRSRFKEVYEWRSIFWQMTILKNVKVSKQCRKYGEKIKKKNQKYEIQKSFYDFFQEWQKKYNKKMKQKYKIISNNKKLHFPKLQSYGPTTYHIP